MHNPDQACWAWGLGEGTIAHVDEGLESPRRVSKVIYMKYRPGVGAEQTLGQLQQGPSDQWCWPKLKAFQGKAEQNSTCSSYELSQTGIAPLDESSLSLA